MELILITFQKNNPLVTYLKSYLKSFACCVAKCTALYTGQFVAVSKSAPWTANLTQIGLDFKLYRKQEGVENFCK